MLHESRKFQLYSLKYVLSHNAQCSFYCQSWFGPAVSKVLAIMRNLLELCNKRFLGPSPYNSDSVGLGGV